MNCRLSIAESKKMKFFFACGSGGTKKNPCPPGDGEGFGFRKQANQNLSGLEWILSIFKLNGTAPFSVIS